MANAARHEPEAVAALRAGREDRVNRLLRLPMPEPYVPTRLEAARDRLRTRPTTPAKPKPAAKPKAKAKSARASAKDDRRRTAHAADGPVRRSGHHGGRPHKPGGRARSLKGHRSG